MGGPRRRGALGFAALVTVGAVAFTGVGTAGAEAVPAASQMAADTRTQSAASTSVAAVSTSGAAASTLGSSGAAASTFAAPKKKLKLGAKGKTVVLLQKRLAELGYRPGKADGRYGGSTLTAIWAFQKVNGIRPTSTISSRTWNALETPKLPKVLVKNGKPTRAEVNLSTQIMVMYVKGEPKLITHISSGSGIPYCETTTWQGKSQRFCGSARTPTGNFRTTWRRSGWHKSYLGQLYNPIFFNGGIAFHGALSVPLSPASHGCVRLPMNVAQTLPGMLGKGVPVHVRGAFKR